MLHVNGREQAGMKHLAMVGVGRDPTGVMTNADLAEGDTLGPRLEINHPWNRSGSDGLCKSL